MTPAARVVAAIEVLDQILGGRSAEQALSGWARTSRFAGSKDRAALRDLVFDALRCRSSCAALGGGLSGRGLMIGLGAQTGWDMAAVFSGEGHAPAPLTLEEQAVLHRPPELTAAERDDLPEWLWPMWYADLGEAAAEAAQSQRARASLFLRVNLRRGDVAQAQSALAAEGIVTVPHPVHEGCLEVTEHPRRVKSSRAFVEGLVEIQDAASQMAVAALAVPKGARVLDYCAGGGGKALALADRFDCAIVAHDIRAARMQDIPDRAARAGVTMEVCETAELGQAGQFDVVVVDAPCSGSGTWRRNPEAKWALTSNKLQDFSALQGDVLANASAYLRLGGTLVYMTCSVFTVENDAVVAAFTAKHPDFAANPALRLTPGPHADGFFCVTLRHG